MNRRRAPVTNVAPAEPVPPQAVPIPQWRYLHAAQLSDPYAYFRDRAHPSLRAYLHAEQRYFAAVSGSLQVLQQRVFDEFCARAMENDRSVPERMGGLWYYSRWREGKQYPLHCRAGSVEGNDEQVYLDENALAAGHDYFDLAAMALSPDQRWLAYLVDVSGDELYRLVLRDLDTGTETLVVEDAGDSVCWGENGASLVYTRADNNARPCSVWLHRLGSPSAEDRLLLEEPDPAFFLSAWKSRSRCYLFIESASHTTTEIHLLSALDIRNPECVRPRQTGIEYYLDHQDQRFLILTNWQAPNYRLLWAPVGRFRDTHWQTLLAERADVTLEYVEPFAEFLVVGERRAGVERLQIIDRSGSSHTLALPEPSYGVELEDLDDYRTDFIRVEYSSLKTPTTVFDYFPAETRRVTRKVQQVPGYQSQDYRVERIGVRAADGVEVPVSLVCRTPCPLNGGHPLLLLAYGAYGDSLDLGFDSDLLSLLDRGVIVALAHVRGGGELGQTWHDGGRLRAKENSFGDFLACARGLIQRGYTTPGRIAAWGSSAGGLLVAVAAHRAPRLFCGIVAEVPFVDVINTLLDRSLPLTAHDLEEFGDPQVQDDFRVLVGYSPYDNVRPQVYPPLLVTAAMQDQRVAYWEPLKWVARLRANKTDANPLWLRVESGGHSGESGRYRQRRNLALGYAFLLQCWGLTGRGPEQGAK